MILVPVRVAPSAIEGNGLVAVHAIARGTPVWRFQPGFDQAFSPDSFEALPEPARAHLRHFAWARAGDRHWILSGDLACFMNHSPDPNTGVEPDARDTAVTVALRPIAAGEELTCDYFAFDHEASFKLPPRPAK